MRLHEWLASGIFGHFDQGTSVEVWIIHCDTRVARGQYDFALYFRTKVVHHCLPIFGMDIYPLHEGKRWHGQSFRKAISSTRIVTNFTILAILLFFILALSFQPLRRASAVPFVGPPLGCCGDCPSHQRYTSLRGPLKGIYLWTNGVYRALIFGQPYLPEEWIVSTFTFCKLRHSRNSESYWMVPMT